METMTLMTCGCVPGTYCRRHTLMVADLNRRFGGFPKTTRVSHAPVDEGNVTMNERDETTQSAQADGDQGSAPNPGVPTEQAEAPAASDAPAEGDEAPAQTN